MPRRSDIIRSLMPIVLVGFLIVLVALLFLLWPVDSGTRTMQHLARIIAPGDTEFGLARRLLDLGIYVVVMIGFAFLLAAWRDSKRNALIGLMAIGILGTAYGSGMALYAGPMCSICGFLLILFGGLVAWAASSPAETGEPEELPGADKHPANDRSKGPDELVDIRTNNHASYSVA